MIFAHGFPESNPLFFAKQPSLARMNLIGMPVTFGIDYASFRMSQSRKPWVRKISWALPATDAGYHVGLGAVNLRKLKESTK
jgi:hypothetical protein